MDLVRFADAQALLAQLGTVSSDVVLIGGQAVNFWAGQYLARSAELQGLAPFTSKDIDFCGSVQHAEACARALGGRCRVFGPDQLTRRQAVVDYMDGLSRARSVDFLASPFGVDGAELRAMAVPIDVPRPPASPLVGHVMHPIHVLESRVANVAELPGYRADKGLKQLRVAVVTAREFARDMLEAGRVRDVLRLNERVFRLAKATSGLSVWAVDRINVFDAVLRDARLPEAFEQIRYPQMRDALTAAQQASLARSPARTAESPSCDVEEFLLVSKAFVGSGWQCVLRDGTGTERVVRGAEFGADEPSAGDTVRLSGGKFELVSRGLERGRSF